MTYALPKLIICLLIALVSMGVLAALHGRPGEERWLRRLSVLTWGASLGLAIVLYGFFPAAVQFSDAVIFYGPETRALLEGKIPYHGFATSYAPLFHALLVVPLLLWDSPGAITLLMILAEGVLLGSYLVLSARQKRTLLGWRTTWLVVSSPALLYWIGIGGYNSVLIASFSMVGLVLAAGGRSLAAGVAGAMSFLGCKLLGVLSWPTIVFYRESGRLRRAFPMALSVVILGIAFVVGIDVWMPIRREGGGWSDGNLWFLLAAIFPALYKSAAVDILSPLSFLVGYGLGTWRFLRHRETGEAARFDRAVAHLALAMAFFLFFSRKTMGMYPPMALPFVVHTLLARDEGRLRVRTVLPVFFIGITATVFPHMHWLDEVIETRGLFGSGTGALLLLAQLLKLAALVGAGLAAWSALGRAEPRGIRDRTVPAP